jgi:hypothetical protein
MSKRYWLIRGHDSFKTIFERKVRFGQFSADPIQDLLKALTAKMGLTCDEIVGGYAKRKTKIANDHPAIHYDFSTYVCGSNPVFTANRQLKCFNNIPSTKAMQDST